MPTLSHKLRIQLGNLETGLLPEARDISIEKPVYICGLPRSGSTMLLEILASHPDVATHQYRDFYFPWTPCVTRKILSLSGRKRLRERAHGDGMMVNAASPEALEEMLWMAFFPDLHRADIVQIMDQSLFVPAFERFYREHIRKLLWVSKAKRYVAKNHYNISRMAYLLKLFPDARFIIPVRKPVEHIASLMRQQQRFSANTQAKSMARTGHFEFGPNRTPINIGSPRMPEIQKAWKNGQEVRGWALYWNEIYRFIYEQLQQLPGLKQQVLIVPFESLCGQPSEIINKLEGHTNIYGIDPSWEKAVRAPNSHASGFSNEEIMLIENITGETTRLFYSTNAC